MIVGETLKAWTKDRAAQRATQAAIDGFGDDWSRGPIHRRFDDAMASLPAARHRRTGRRQRLQILFATWLGRRAGGRSRGRRCARTRSSIRPSAISTTTCMPACSSSRTSKVSIAAGVTSALQLAARKNRPRGATSVGFSGQLNVLKFVKAGGADPLLLGGAADRRRLHRRRGRHLPAHRRTDGSLTARPIVDGRHQSYVIEGLQRQHRPAAGLDRRRPGAAQRRI